MILNMRKKFINKNFLIFVQVIKVRALGINLMS